MNTLFDPPPPPNVEMPLVEPPRYVRIRIEANQWMDENPEAMGWFRKFCLQLMRAGRRFGINLIRERVRWEATYKYGEDHFKFCNSYSPYVARRLIQEIPGLENHIRCRRTKEEMGLLPDNWGHGDDE